VSEIEPLDDCLERGRQTLLASLRRKKPREPKDAPAKKRQHPERDLQRAVVTLARRAFPQVVLASYPAEQRGTGDADQRARFGAARKASGVLTGHPDIIVYLPGGRVLLWELKAEKGRTSAAQDLMHARLSAIGHGVEVIRSVDAAAEALRRAVRA
jgi:LmbE family N-acetylglucosaminyl deacetylase